MKYTIMGINQAKAIELKLNLNHLLILNYFKDFRDTNLMVTKVFDGKPMYWLKYEAVLENLPILGINSKVALRRYLKQLEDAKVLTYNCEKTKDGTFTFYGVGERYLELYTKQNDLVGNSSEIVDNISTKQKSIPPTKQNSLTGLTEKFNRGQQNSLTGSTEKFNQKITLLKDSPIKDITLLEEKKEQSSTSSDSLLGIKKVIYLTLKEVSPQDIAYKTFFESCEVIEDKNKVVIKAPNSIYGIMPSKYMNLIKKVLDKPVELIKSEEN